MNYKEILNGYRDEISCVLSELVSFESVKTGPADGKPFGEAIHRAYSYMLAKAKGDGFDTFDVDGYGGHIEWLGAVTDERGEIVSAADETLGAIAHLDVSPAGDGWGHDPWACETVGGRIYGRGTADGKGAAVAVYYAMKALKESGFLPARNMRLILGLDAETGWSGLEKYLAGTTAPDFCFTPDAEFPVINGGMGILVFEIAKKLETSNENGLHLRSMKGGGAPDMVPDQCRAILTFEDGVESKAGKARRKSKAGQAGKGKDLRGKAFALVKEAAADYRRRSGGKLSCKGVGNSLEVLAQGIPAPGAGHRKGVNAISILVDFLGSLPIVNESARDFLDFCRNHIGFETDGKGLGIQMSDRLSGPLILNAGMIRVSRGAAVLTVNVRYPLSKKEDDVYKALRPILGEKGLGVVKKSGAAPFYLPPDDFLVKTLMEAYRDNTGDEESPPKVGGGDTCARAFPRAVAFGPRFPREEGAGRQKDEYISLDSLMSAAQIYADALCRLCEKSLSQV